MKHRVLGRTGWNISEISCGTFRSFDISAPEGPRRVAALMRANLDAGVNLFDSAPMYGHSEANIGAALPLLGGLEAPRGYIATKVLQSTRAAAQRQVADSFARIGGRMDLLQIHNMAGWREVLPWLGELREAGRIGAVGVTHYDPSAFGEMEQALRTGIPDVIQVPWNLREREVERRLIPLADELNLGVLVMTPMQPIFNRASLLRALAGLDLTPFRPHGIQDAGGLCLKWLLDRHPRAVPLPATSHAERVASNAAVSGTPPVPPELWARVEKHLG